MKTLRHIADEINGDPSLGLRAEVKKSWSNTDRAKPRGLRYRIHEGKGRNGLKLTVFLIRTGKPVCEVDTSETYQMARDAAEWLADWRAFRRTYHRVPAPRFNQRFVEGEPRPSRGRVLTYDQLAALKTGDRVWVRVKEHGEDYNRLDEAMCLTVSQATRPDGTVEAVNFIFGHIDFCSNDPDMPKGSQKLSWDDGENEISLAQVTTTPHVEKD